MCADARDARLSNYRLERLLGSGGMGEVYLARDLALDRPVAIKFISPDKAADASARKRLIREARAAAALEHPNICGVHEVIDEPDGRACIVMQYVDGKTVAELLREGPLDERLAFTVAADVAAALGAAHKQGLIHRDVKPQNIVVTPENRAKLLDFGLARHHEPPAAGSDRPTETALTEPVFVLGTPAYMSPEQARHLPLDGRSDLFSLGSVLYECLTGTRAFNGESSLELAGQVIHAQPPPVSSLRSSLTPQHDELCRRLLAKHPDDRFQTADELIGALRVFTKDTARDASAPAPARRSWTRGPAAALIAVMAVLIAVAGLAAWRWRIPSEPEDPGAAGWYRRGTSAIRDGAYHSGRLALSEAIKASPEYAPAWIRMAEAEAELGEVESAQQALLRVDDLVPSKLRLPFSERKRIEAVRALMLRETDEFVRAYGELAKRHPRDPGAWLDLGRAQDAAERTAEALASFERALEIDDQYAAAHLRRASSLGFEGRRDEALRAFTEAERLYEASANLEGQVETLIRRGAFLNGALELREARTALERAVELAKGVRSRAQEIRARLILSSVTASEGQWKAAEQMAAEAVDEALTEHLEGVAADGLVDLANVLIIRNKRAEADVHLVRAIDLADKHGASRVAARARLQRAAIMTADGNAEDAIEAARTPLEFFKANRYRRYEVNALSIMARSYEQLGRYRDARSLTDEALKRATELRDQGQIGEALENLGGQANAVGALPDAAEYRRRSVELHREQNDVSTLSFDLLNRADLLIRLGRHTDAMQLLDEIDAGIAQQSDAFLPRARRVRQSRALSAAIQQKADEVVRYARDFPPRDDGTSDSTSQFAALLLQYAATLPGQRATSPAPSGPPAGSTTSTTGRELRYWDLAVRLARDPRAALAAAEDTLESKGTDVSYEFEWRIAAIGAAAARRLNDTALEGVLRERAEHALGRLRREWKADVASYEARPDLADLRRKAGLTH